MLSSLIMATTLSVGMLLMGQVFLAFGITHRNRCLTWVSIPWCAAGVALSSLCGYAVTRDIAHIQVSSHTIYAYFVMLCAGNNLPCTSSAKNQEERGDVVSHCTQESTLTTHRRVHCIPVSGELTLLIHTILALWRYFFLFFSRFLPLLRADFSQILFHILSYLCYAG